VNWREDCDTIDRSHCGVWMCRLPCFSSQLIEILLISTAGS